VAEASSEPVTLSPEHFLRSLDLGLTHEPGRSTLRARIGDITTDAGLLATLVDVIGGHVVMRERFPVILATTHIELHAIDRLHGPGELVAESTIVASSKRRAVVEVTLRLDEVLALAHAGFAVREDPGAGGDGWVRPRGDAVISDPLWQQIGVETVDGGAQVTVHPLIHNHIGGLQGGAMVALLERGALVDAPDGTVVTDAAINYLTQARTHLVRAVRRSDLGDVVSIDGIGAGNAHAFANAVFRLRRPA
jgi:acyl-coenzyme A thioesterase PaaI-like protein